MLRIIIIHKYAENYKTTAEISLKLSPKNEAFDDKPLWYQKLIDFSIETLGVAHEAKDEEIQEAYNRMKHFYEKSEDPNMKIYFDDLTLAYNTLINHNSRAEYDEYISSH